jgi:ribonuclease HI
MSFYAVKKGRVPGIYLTWNECEKQVVGFSGAQYKKFLTEDHAKQFIDGSVPVVAKPNSGIQVVYTDGACENNQKSKTGGAVGGVGVYFGKGDSRNIAEPLIGPQTNNRAELTAAVRALEVTTGPIEIRTDSQYLIQGMTSWIHSWGAFDPATGGFVWYKTKENMDIWTHLFLLARNRQIVWTHVRGHTGEAGNEAADSLARLGANRNAKLLGL